MSLGDIIDVSIKYSTAAVVAAGFGKPLIAGPTTPGFTPRYHDYNELVDMVADGYALTDPECLAVAALLSQAKRPKTFAVGRRLPAVAMIDTITPTAINTTHYLLTVDGTVYDYTSDASATITEICDGLRALMNADAALLLKLTPSGTTTIVLTAVTAGFGFSTSVGANLALVHTTANHGIAEDLADFRAAGAVWYGTDMTSRSVLEVREASAWIEANSSDIPVIGMFQTSEAASGSAAVNTAGTDLLNRLAALKYKRSAVLFHSLDAEYGDAAWLGRELPVDPGADNWALKVLAGISPDALSTTYKTNIAAKSGNYYYGLTAQNPITWPGKVSSGAWIDVIRFIDFLKARIAEAVANLMLDAEKVEFDDRGLQLIGAQVSGVLQQAKNAGKLVSFNVQIPRAADIPSANRAARTLDPPITFDAILSGALNSAKVSGTVTE